MSANRSQPTCVSVTPAVAAWGIFGILWDAINELVDGIADASEIRCAFLLGSGQPERARLSAYKSLMICMFTSLFLTSILYTCGEDIPIWMTNDPTLQHLLTDLLPMFGLGNASMCLGTMSWTLLGAQGRYRLATVVVFVVSWVFSLPLAAVSSIYLNVNLKGQTATVLMGYMISGAIHAYFLFRSDWFALSQNVMDDNGSRASDGSSYGDMPTTKADDTSEGTPKATPEHQLDLPTSEPPSLRCDALTYQPKGPPSPPSDEDDIPLPQPMGISGQWHDRTEDVEIELSG